MGDLIFNHLRDRTRDAPGLPTAIQIMHKNMLVFQHLAQFGTIWNSIAALAKESNNINRVL